MQNIFDYDLITIDFDLPYPIHVSDQPFSIKDEDINCTLKFTKIKRDNLDPRLRLDGGNFDLIEDRYGWVRYSKVIISIAHNQMPPNPVNVKPEEWPIEIAVSAVNRFLNEYKDLNNIAWIRLINPSEVWAADVIYYKDSTPKRTINFKRLHQIKPPIKGLKEDIENNLRQHLQDSKSANEWKLLLLDAEDALSRADTRLAIINGQAAIELAISTLLLYKFRLNQTPLKDVRDALEQKRALSYEEATEKASIDNKLSNGLVLATGTDLSKDINMWYEWDTANALRVACIHHGYAPSLKQTREVLNIYWKIYNNYLNNTLSNMINLNTDWADYSRKMISIALGQSISNNLCSLMNEILPKLQKIIVLYNIHSYPIAMDRDVSMRTEKHGNHIAIWLNPTCACTKNETFIAEAISLFKLRQEQYPYARVSDNLPDESFRTGWEIVAETMTQVLLRLPLVEQLRNLGFDIDEIIEKHFEKTNDILLSSNYVPPQPNEVREMTMPLEAMELYFSMQEDTKRQQLLNTIAQRAPNSFPKVGCLIKAVKEIGYDTREKCVQLMVRCRNCMMMFDSCLVFDPKERSIYYSSGRRSY